MSSKKRNKVEMEKRKVLLKNLLDKWVCFKQVIDNEERYVYIKHRLRDGKSYSKVEQIILSDDPVECGVYYITDYEIDRVLDYAINSEIIEMKLVRFDQEIGVFSEKNRLESIDELKDYLVENDYLTMEDIKRFSDPHNKPPGIQ